MSAASPATIIDTLHSETQRPNGEPTAAMVLVHGFGEHCGRYGAFIAALNEMGVAVVAYDQRGHGRSPGRPGYVRSNQDLVGDATGMLRRTRSEFPNIPMILFGHSMGGSVATACASAYPDLIDLLMLSAPAVTLHEKPTGFLRFLVQLMSAILPIIPVTKLDAGGVSSDPAVVQRYQNDPHVHHGFICARTVEQLVSLGERAIADCSRIKCPTVIAHGSGDTIASEAGAKEIDRQIGTSDRTLKLYPKLAHEILNEPDQAEVRSFYLDWLRERL